jgi:hypothetical protein
LGRSASSTLPCFCTCCSLLGISLPNYF